MFRFLFALYLSLTLAGATPTPAKSHSRRRGKRGSTRTAPVQHSQTAPTSDRYREIQQALVTKGYLKSDLTGVWDADSQEAMRRFQADQKLDNTGKIDAHSLISLGLGPQH